MFRFKTADPTRRIPTYLQAHTKENLIWQLKMTALLMVGLAAYDRYEEWKFEKDFKENYTPPSA